MIELPIPLLIEAIGMLAVNGLNWKGNVSAVVQVTARNGDRP